MKQGRSKNRSHGFANKSLSTATAATINDLRQAFQSLAAARDVRSRGQGVGRQAPLSVKKRKKTND